MEDKEKLKEILEQTARESDIKVEGETKLKSADVKEAEKECQDWKEEKRDFILHNEFNVPHELLNCLIKTNQYQGLIFTGEGGIGKSVLTISSIKNTLNPEEWEYSSGYTTPLSLYEFLYKNRNKKVIILDDVEGVFNNKLALAILKGALWESDGRRICQYSSKSDKATVPEKFVMKAKVVILCNYIPHENDSSTRAMISRTIFHRLFFSYKEKMNLCENFIKEDKELSQGEKEDVLNLLKENVTEATKDFNFRTLRKLIAFIKYDRNKAKDLFLATTENDDLKEAYLKASRSNATIKAQISMFSEWTGKSRATFFRVKKEVSRSR